MMNEYQVTRKKSSGSVSEHTTVSAGLLAKIHQNLIPISQDTPGVRNSNQWRCFLVKTNPLF
jgi:hypothetical protein